METGRLFDAVCHRKADAAGRRALGKNFRAVRIIKPAQRIEHFPRLLCFIIGRTKRLHNRFSAKQLRAIVKAQNAGMLSQSLRDVLRAGFRRAEYNRYRCFGRIMAIFHARRRDFLAVVNLFFQRTVNIHFAKYRLQLFQRNSTWTQQPRTFAAQ